jgi:hypothetical protein
MNTNEIRMKIAEVKNQLRKAKGLAVNRLDMEMTALQNRLRNTIESEDKARRMAAITPLIAQTAEALQAKEISEAEQKRLDFQVGRREAARAAYMSAHNGSDAGFDNVWGEIQTDLAKSAATEAAASYDPGDVKTAVVAAVLAKYRR